MKKFLCLIILASTLFIFSGCSLKSELENYRPVTDVNDLDGRRIGTVLAWAADYYLTPRKDIKLLRYESMASAIMALKYKKIDAIAIDLPSAIEIALATKGVKIIDGTLDTVGIIFVFHSPEERDNFNEFLKEYKNTEEYKKIDERIKNSEGGFVPRKIDVPNVEGRETLVCGVDTAYYPINYYDTVTRSYQGIETEILKDYANYKGYNIDYRTGDFGSIMMQLDSGKIKVIADGLCELEREDYELANEYVSDIVYYHDIVLVGVEDFEQMEVVDYLG